MIETLKKYVLPVLRDRGFKGSFPHFRRPAGRAMHLLTFQFDKWGGSFIVEIATCALDGVTTHWGEHVPSSRVRAWDVTRRLRLGAADEGSDGQWFRYDKHSLFASGNRFERAALQVLPYIEGQAEDWWKSETERQTPA